MEDIAAAAGMTAGGEAPALGLDNIEAVMRVYRPRVLRYVLYSVRDRDIADTIVQECFLKAYRARDKFRGDCSLSTWLMQIAVNLVKDYARSRKLQFWKRAQNTGVEISELADFLPENTTSAEAQLVAREQLKAVWEAVETLSEMQKQVFLLRFVEEMDLMEIADTIGLKESTVKSHLYRALAAVRTRVQGARG